MADRITPLNRILIIRRDNIGDLICTTPLFRALRNHYPKTQIDALVNSYNVQAIEHSPHLDHIHAYTKRKHKAAGQSLLSVYWRRYQLIQKLRRQKYDLIILAGSFSKHALRTAKSLNAKKTLGFCAEDHPASDLDISLPPPNGTHHEVQRTLQLLTPLTINTAREPLTLVADASTKANLSQDLKEAGWHPNKKLTIGLHISARKPSQRWPTQNFVQLVRLLSTKYNCQCLLFWSPGDATNPHHPGDNQKAANILKQLQNLPIYPVHTEQLRDLIAGISLCDNFICSDGGAMHIAAGLQKPLVCFFGDSDTQQWHPWIDNYQLLQPRSRNVSDISAEMALAAFDKLQTPLTPEESD